jgi:hypothetical protein
MRAARLAEIKEAIEGLDTGKYHGADMLADALVEMTGNARELLEEIERVRQWSPILPGDRVKITEVDQDEDNPVETAVVLKVLPGDAYLVRPETGPYMDTETGLWYSREYVELLED